MAVSGIPTTEIPLATELTEILGNTVIADGAVDLGRLPFSTFLDLAARAFGQQVATLGGWPHDDEPSGRAATADGNLYAALSSVPGEWARIYRRVTGGVAGTLIARLPKIEALDGKADKSTIIVATGLATTSGTLGASPTIGVPAASSAAAVVGVDTSSALTPASGAALVADRIGTAISGKADKSTAIVATGLATTSGTLGASPTIGVPAASSAAAVEGVDTSSALTPASGAALVADRLVKTMLTAAARAPGFGSLRPLVMDDEGRVHLWISPDGIEGKFARPVSVKAPVTGGISPIVMDEEGRVHLAMTPEGIEGRFARPVSVKAPVTGGVSPIVMDEEGRVHLAMTPEGIEGRFARPAAVAAPVTAGWSSIERNAAGGIVRGSHDGVPYDPAAIGQPVGSSVNSLGYKQGCITALDPVTFATETRQVTLSQTGDITPLMALGPTLLKAMGPDPRYPVGGMEFQRRSISASAPQFLRIVITHGQSNGLGGRDEILTPQPALPDHVWMWNGGLRGYVPGASHTWEYVASPSMYASFVGAKFSGIEDQPRDYEGHDLGAGEAVALAYGLRDKVLVQGHAIAGRSVPYLVGDATSYAPAWTNLRSMVTAAVAQAAALGLVPVIEGLIWNSGEAHDTDTKEYWLEQLELIRSRTDELTSLTGQTRRIPIVFMQVAATRAESGDSRYHEPCMATEEWVRDKSRFAAIIPSMWSEQDDLAQVHHKSRFYRHAGEMAGRIMVQMHDTGACAHPMITSAVRRGRVVDVEFNQPVIFDTWGVTDPGNYGVSYSNGVNYITLQSVSLSGQSMRLTLASDPSGIDEVVFLGSRGAKHYPEYGRWGIGAFWGNRHCIRRPAPFGFSHSTGRPLFSWAPQQRFPVTVL